MPYAHYERLTALDESFLDIEDRDTHMHIGAVSVFEGGELVRPDGGLDFARLYRLVEGRIHRIPRYLQRIVRTPLLGHPVWVDDTHFNLAYHVRHTRLPAPGDERMLKRLAGRLMSQELDRGKPLWEMWLVEGVEGGRFAIITKVHHCMIDGVGSVELAGSLMRVTPDADPHEDEPAPRWMPRSTPSPVELLFADLAYRATAPLDLARRLLSSPRAAWHGALEALQGIREVLTAGLSPASPTPFNVPTGPHRRFDWATMDLGAVREIKARLGGTVNDVVLAVMSGALRRFLSRRGEDVDTLDFRAVLPVSVRSETSRRQMGNRIAMLRACLPVDEPDPRRRLERVIAETTRSKGSRQSSGIQAIEAISDRTFSSLFVDLERLTEMARPYNVIVTNVPGPQFPLYLLGSRLLAVYPLVPLFPNQALGVALFSYDGTLFWGFNADWDALPDLHDLVTAVEHELGKLHRAAEGAAPGATAAGQATG
ncbi:MAG: wax ester/triacylglycerol synthase family O-acyltransferase [Thermodesulfobacteriota bacterium]